jgi:hypothetical protein
MSRRFVVGYFEREDALLQAVKGLRAEGWNVHDVYTPYPVPGMDEALGLTHSWLGWVTFIGGMSGALGMLATEIYVAVIAWPVNIGGRPNASLPAFFPPVFEAGILIGALSTVGALLWVCNLFPGQFLELDTPTVTDDGFAVALDADQAPNAGEKIAGTLRGRGAFNVSEQTAKEAL